MRRQKAFSLQPNVASRSVNIQSRRDKIAQFICESRKIFEEYRYVYERDSDDRENIGFVCVFAEALEKLVGKMIWKTVFQMAGIEDKI